MVAKAPPYRGCFSLDANPAPSLEPSGEWEGAREGGRGTRARTPADSLRGGPHPPPSDGEKERGSLGAQQAGSAVSAESLPGGRGLSPTFPPGTQFPGGAPAGWEQPKAGGEAHVDSGVLPPEGPSQPRGNFGRGGCRGRPGAAAGWVLPEPLQPQPQASPWRLPDPAAPCGALGPGLTSDVQTLGAAPGISLRFQASVRTWFSQGPAQGARWASGAPDGLQADGIRVSGDVRASRFLPPPPIIPTHSCCFSLTRSHLPPRASPPLRCLRVQMSPGRPAL